MPKTAPYLDSVDIRPGVTILSVLRHLNYKPWFALAEFVDNSLQSFLANKDRLRKVEGKDFRLTVDIDLDLSAEPRLVIRDNAAGIATADYTRAFRAAAVPLDRRGLSEFGMGMKSAACYFAPQWHVRTTALGEELERTVHFDIERIVGGNIEALKVQPRDARPDTRYTIVTLENLHQAPQTKTLGKIKEYLADIYRVFTRDGVMVLNFNGEPLTHETPDILEAPFYRGPKGTPKVWRKDINFDLGEGMKVWGFAAIRAVGSTTKAGFALFRRNRLIQGGADEGYRPEYIFGKSNSYRYQRVFGELHLEGFEVSHTKDGFRWDENEQPFLGLLKDHLDSEELPLLQQAEGLRTRPKKGDLRAGAKAAVEHTAAAVQHAVEDVLPGLADDANAGVEVPKTLPRVSIAAKEVIKEIEFQGQKWTITIELADDPAVVDWLTIMDDTDSTVRKISLRLSLDHPFMERFGGTTAEEIEPLLRVATGLGLSEVIARDSGIRKAGRIRHNLNDLLRDSLANP